MTWNRPTLRQFGDLLKRLTREESIGHRGEQVAARYLRKRGYRIVECNLRIGKDEADIIAIDPSGVVVVVVEVKTRSGSERSPELAVTAAKQHRLTRLAAHLKKRSEYQAMILRFDVVTVNETQTGDEVHHFQAAFDSTL